MAHLCACSSSSIDLISCSSSLGKSWKKEHHDKNRRQYHRLLGIVGFDGMSAHLFFLLCRVLLRALGTKHSLRHCWYSIFVGQALAPSYRRAFVVPPFLRIPRYKSTARSPVTVWISQPITHLFFKDTESLFFYPITDFVFLLPIPLYRLRFEQLPTDKRCSHSVWFFCGLGWLTFSTAIIYPVFVQCPLSKRTAMIAWHIDYYNVKMLYFHVRKKSAGHFLHTKLHRRELVCRFEDSMGYSSLSWIRKSAQTSSTQESST